MLNSLQVGDSYLAIANLQALFFVTRVMYKAFLHVPFFQKATESAILPLDESVSGMVSCLNFYYSFRLLRKLHEERLLNDRVGCHDSPSSCEYLPLHLLFSS